MVNENASRMAETSHLGRVVNVESFFLVTGDADKKAAAFVSVDNISLV